MPPARCRSVATYRPDGLRSQSTGTRARIASKSSISSGTPAAFAIASRCSTALVEPPIAIATAMAFSKASRVRIWRGTMPRSIACDQRRAGRAGAVAFSGSSAAMVEEYGRLIPIASIDRRHGVGRVHSAAGSRARAGAALDFHSSRSSMVPALCWPTASNALTIVEICRV